MSQEQKRFYFIGGKKNRKSKPMLLVLAGMDGTHHFLAPSLHRKKACPIHSTYFLLILRPRRREVGRLVHRELMYEESRKRDHVYVTFLGPDVSDIPI